MSEKNNPKLEVRFGDEKQAHLRKKDPEYINKNLLKQEPSNSNSNRNSQPSATNSANSQVVDVPSTSSDQTSEKVVKENKN